jgi:hypothetical protein
LEISSIRLILNASFHLPRLRLARCSPYAHIARIAHQDLHMSEQKKHRGFALWFAAAFATGLLGFAQPAGANYQILRKSKSKARRSTRATLNRGQRALYHGTTADLAGLIMRHGLHQIEGVPTLDTINSKTAFQVPSMVVLAFRPLSQMVQSKGSSVMALSSNANHGFAPGLLGDLARIARGNEKAASVRKRFNDANDKGTLRYLPAIAFDLDESARATANIRNPHRTTQADVERAKAELLKIIEQSRAP